VGYAVELYFDTAAEARVRALWNTLAQRDVSRVLLDLGHRPHKVIEFRPVVSLCTVPLGAG